MKKTLTLLYSLFCVVCPQLAIAADNPVIDAARQAESRLDARVGLAIHDTGSGKSWLYRADERFPITSTFKVMACAALLARQDAGNENLERRVRIAQADLVTYSPVTEGWSGQEVGLGELCAATMRTSDNTAANKVLDAIGGPEALTAFMRSLGDRTTRLDRRETALNEGTPGDQRDTSSPAAMAASLEKLVLGDALSSSSRKKLTGWLVGNEVGGPLLRAGIPDDWLVGDRTGAGGHGSRSVVAVMWPPERAPVVAAIYITQTGATMEQRNEAIAAIGSALAKAVSGKATLGKATLGKATLGKAVSGKP